MAGAPPTLEATDDLLRPYVPQILSLWGRGPAAVGGRLLAGALVSADVSGFTRLSERLAGLGREGAEELTELLNAVFDGMVGAADLQGGDVLAFGGDALFLLFSGADHAARACHAAVAMREVVEAPLESRLAGRVRLRISQGIHVGAVPLVVVDADRLELLVAGPCVSRTVQCEAVARAGQIVLSDEAAAVVPPGWLAGHVDRGRLLRRALPRPEPWLTGATRVHDPGRFLSTAVRERVRAGGGGEHRRVTTAFVSVPHTDAIAARGTAELAEALQGVASAVAAATRESGVHWLASDVHEDGLKIILAAGAPAGGRDDEGRMLRCLRAVLAASPLPLKVGVNAGHVFAGELGSRQRRAYTVMGDAVNVAARLMAVAAPGEIVASQVVVTASRAHFHVTGLPRLALKGRSAAVEAVTVGEERQATPSVATRRFPFVGRADVMRVLGDAVQACAAAAGRPVELVGVAGNGMTRLLQEFIDTLDVPVLRAGGDLYRRERPYWAVQPLIREALGIAVDANRDEAGAALSALVAERAPDLASVLPFIAVSLDAEVPATPASRETAPAFRRSRLRRGVLALLERVLPPTGVIVVEDAHWLDEASRDLVGAMMRLSRRRGWLVLTGRHPGLSLAPDGVEPLDVELGPLSDDATVELAAAMLVLLGDASPREARLLAARSGGNPLFLTELAAAAVEHGGMSGLPESIEAIVTERIDLLEPRERRLLREVSVLGSRVELGVLAAVIGDDSVLRRDVWDPLEEFVEWGGDRDVVFRHALFHEVAYTGLSYRRRRQVHLLAGEHLEASSTAPELRAEVLSLHFHEAGDRGRAWHYSLAAAERARQRFATETAADFYERALANATHLPEVGGGEIARVAELLGDACETVAKYERATRAYTQARRLREDSLAQSGLLRKEGVLRERTARYVEALRWYGRARRLAHLATGTEAQTQRASIDLAAAGVRFRQGRYAEGVRLCESAVAIAERLGDTRQRATAYFLLDLGYTYLQRPESADYRGRALPIYEEIGDLVGQARTLNNLGAVAYFEGRWDEALERFAEYRERSERAGDIVNAATAMNNIGEILSDQGRVGDAVELFREARRIWRATGYTIGVALATCNLGRAEARLGAHEAALAQLHEGEAAFEAIGVPEFVALAQAWRSECLLFAGRPAEALEVAGRLVERGRGGVDDHAVGAVAHRTMALAFLRLDKPAEAQAALEIARRESAGTPYEVAHTLLAVAALEDGPGGRRGDEARNEALDILERLGAASARLHE